MESCDSSLLLSYNEDYSDTYDTITLHCEEKFSIGIKYDWHGLQPNILILPKTQKIVCSFENEIVCINCESKVVDFRHSLNSLVFSIIHVEDLSLIIVIHEFGVFVINEKGQKIWACGGTDIIQDYKLVDKCINIRCADGYEIAYSIVDGKAIC
ncbi:hypothetical protein BD780_000820 [Clostridium tetanomorphum]|uniref:hypothetical protein n=1 Tax=Clostridium tetanomorphum TaxID=1553 RepID=UPI0011BE4308|nr:hypothetical protein [Clostridium tetanomorphum]MBP1863497.1 hypothetical protein [Clostridium tetanomorphum]NRS83595.1 hypothetical protein [Clostridium tetanomorphum]